MKRDIDLARALLFDIESEGPDCPINRLHAASVSESMLPEAAPTDTSERVRYHLRLLIDAGLAKEVDRTNAGVPCMRLTNAGHELLELCRSDVRWREAKQYSRETTGGVSLTVMRAVLTKWGVEGVAVAGRGYRGYRRAVRPYYHRVEPRRRYDGYRYDYREPVVRDPLTEEEELRLVRTRPDYRERFEVRERVDLGDRYDSTLGSATDYVVSAGRYDYPVDAQEPGVGVTLPIYLV